MSKKTWQLIAIVLTLIVVLESVVCFAVDFDTSDNQTGEIDWSKSETVLTSEAYPPDCMIPYSSTVECEDGTVITADYSATERYKNQYGEVYEYNDDMAFESFITWVTDNQGASLWDLDLLYSFKMPDNEDGKVDVILHVKKGDKLEE